MHGRYGTHEALSQVGHATLAIAAIPDHYFVDGQVTDGFCLDVGDFGEAFDDQKGRCCLVVAATGFNELSVSFGFGIEDGLSPLGFGLFLCENGGGFTFGNKSSLFFFGFCLNDLALFFSFCLNDNFCA